MPNGKDENGKKNTINPPTQFIPDCYDRPGEYGRKDTAGGRQQGFVVVDHPGLNGQRIYICSSSFIDGLKQRYKIPDTHHVTMLACDEYDESIPETSFKSKYDAVTGVALFRKRLEKLKDIKDGDIIINCYKGHNRSPIAALIYMVDRGIPYNDSHQAIEQALKIRFGKKYKLNPYKQYTAILQSLESTYQEQKEATQLDALFSMLNITDNNQLITILSTLPESNRLACALKFQRFIQSDTDLTAISSLLLPGDQQEIQEAYKTNTTAATTSTSHATLFAQPEADPEPASPPTIEACRTGSA